MDTWMILAARDAEKAAQDERFAELHRERQQGGG